MPSHQPKTLLKPPDQSTDSSIRLSTDSLDQSTDRRIPADQSKNSLIPQTSQRMLQYLRRIKINQPARLITGHADTSRPINWVTDTSRSNNGSSDTPRSVSGAFYSGELRFLDRSILSTPWAIGFPPLDDGTQPWTSDPNHGFQISQQPISTLVNRLRVSTTDFESQ